MIFLASQSPRRAELLRQIGVEYQVRVADIDETPLQGEASRDYVLRLAEAKARVIADELEADSTDWVVLAADTTIDCDGDTIGKPANATDCCQILGRLSGREHEVLTAVAVATPAGIESRLSRTRVRFRDLDEAEMRAYCASAEPLDKAGAYAIQGRAAVFVEQLEGSYSGVVGLPLCETAELLRRANIEIF